MQIKLRSYENLLSMCLVIQNFVYLRILGLETIGWIRYKKR